MNEPGDQGVQSYRAGSAERTPEATEWLLFDGCTEGVDRELSE